MAENPSRQISFRCSEEFYKRFQDEKRRRCLNTQEMVVQALTESFDKAKQIRESSATVVTTPINWATPEEQDFVRALLEYTRALPGRKKELLMETLALDAKYYASARLTGSRFARTPKVSPYDDGPQGRE